MLLADAAIAVEPPRATRWQKRLRRWIPWRRQINTARSELSTIGHAMRSEAARELNVEVPPLRLLTRMVFPGWAHSYAGFRLQSRCFAAAYALMLLAAIICYGSTPGAFFIGAAIAVHASSVVDLFLREGEPTARGMATAMGLALVLVAAIYWPSIRLADSVVTSRQLIDALPPLVPGDVMLVLPRAYRRSAPQPGDVVLYQVPEVSSVTRQHTQFRVVGERIDRILAGPNSTVRWDGHLLTVNGKPSPLSPLSLAGLPQKLTIQTRANTCCILPSIDPFMHGHPDQRLWEQAGNVPLNRIIGRVVARTYPLWRFWRAR